MIFFGVKVFYLMFRLKNFKRFITKWSYTKKIYEMLKTVPSKKLDFIRNWVLFLLLSTLSFSWKCLKKDWFSGLKITFNT